MAIYRERRTIDRPPAAVARAVFGDADVRSSERGTAGLYRVRTDLDGAAGEVRTAVHVPGVAVLTAVAVIVALLGIRSPALRVVGFWLCAGAVLAPLAYLLPGVTRRPGAGRVVDRRISPVTAPAYAAAVGSLWLTLSPALGAVAAWLSGTLLVVGTACYAIGAGWRTATVSTLWLPAAGLLPTLTTIGVFAVVLATADQGSDLALPAGIAIAAFSIVAIACYSYLVCRSVRTARFEPLAPGGRRLWLAGYLAVLLVLATAFVGLAARVAGLYGVVVTVVLAAPLAIPVGGWVNHTARSLAARLQAVHRAERHTVDGVPVYVVPATTPRVTAISIPRGVVVSSAVVETLSDAELAAVVAHERHHLDDRSRLTVLAVGLAAVLVGRNPVAAFLDAPAQERSADRYAAARAGREPLIAALRRLEGLDGASSTDPSLLTAPQALLFGTVPDVAIYPSVDDRIAAVAR